MLKPSGPLGPESSNLNPFSVKTLREALTTSGSYRSAAVLRDLFQSFVQTKSGSIGTMGGHGLDHIGYRQDACLQENLLAMKTEWISRSIHPFMVLKHDLSDLPEGLYVLQYVIGGLRMGLDDGEFQFSQVARFAEYLSR